MGGEGFGMQLGLGVCDSSFGMGFLVKMSCWIRQSPVVSLALGLNVITLWGRGSFDNHVWDVGTLASQYFLAGV